MRRAARFLSGLAFGVVAASIAAHLALAKPPIDYQDPPADPLGSGVVTPVGPGQIQPQMPERLNGVGAFQRLPFIDESGFVVVAVRNEPYWKAGLADPVLTNACRLGDFVSVPLNRMVVRFTSTEGPGALAYIPPDRRHLLVDRRALAKPGEIYYFLNSTFATCQVWVENPVKPLRRLTKGTSLPPADPQALAKKKALIESWEKPAQKQ
jgi:hypothetical protein